MILPFWWQWDADNQCMRPTPRFSHMAKITFTDGHRYRLGEVHDRSANSHDHYFACVNAAWDNLQGGLITEFPSPTHLRKWALCKAGFAAERTILFQNRGDAIATAKFLRPSDPYSIISVRECMVHVFTAESQSLKAMGRVRFEESKEGVLRILSELIGTDITTLKKNAQTA